MLKKAAVLFCALLLTSMVNLWSSITWQPPVDLSATGGNAFGMQVAVDEAGNAVAVWVRNNGANSITQAATLPFGGAWTAPVDLSAAGQDAFIPQVVVDGAGNAVAVWVRNNGANSIIQAATLPFGGAWTAPVDLSAAGQNASNPQVAVDGAGNAVAVWERSNGANTIVQAATLPFGGVWTAPVNLSVAGQDAGASQVAVDGAGNAVAVWVRFNGANTIIQAATLPFGGVWTAPVDLSAAGQNARDPQVAVDGAGNAVAVWFRSNGANTIIQAATLPFGGVWTAPVDLSVAGQNAGTPQVAVDGAGNAVAVWSRSDGANLIIQAATLPFGGAWTAPVDLSVAGQNASNPQVAVDGAGNAVAVWELSDGVNDIIQTATLPFGGVWTTPVDLSVAAPNAFNPQVAVDGAGNAVAVWGRFNGANSIIQASTGIATDPPTGGNGHQVLNRFGFQSEYFNELQWNASTSEVIAYRIYRNGLFLAEVPSTHLSYRDHLQEKGVAVTYTVTAVSLTGGESAPITITIP